MKNAYTDIVQEMQTMNSYRLGARHPGQIAGELATMLDIHWTPLKDQAWVV
jgi:hypothetical protein